MHAMYTDGFVSGGAFIYFGGGRKADGAPSDQLLKFSVLLDRTDKVHCRRVRDTDILSIESRLHCRFCKSFLLPATT